MPIVQLSPAAISASSSSLRKRCSMAGRWCALLLALLTIGCSARGAFVDGVPPELETLNWINAEPQFLETQEAKVVLLVFFTDSCGFCRRYAPYLEQLRQQFDATELQVLGVFHGSEEEASATIATLDLSFPVAVDLDQGTLRNWCPEAIERGISCTFLISETIRSKHMPESTARPIEEQYRLLQREIRKLVAQR